MGKIKEKEKEKLGRKLTEGEKWRRIRTERKDTENLLQHLFEIKMY